MREADQTVSAFEALQPWVYDHIVRVVIEVIDQTDHDVGVTVVTIWLRRGREPAAEALKVVFTGVTGLVIKPFSFPSGPLTVTSWVAQGWDGINFRVDQSEQHHEAVELYCHDFAFALVEDPKPTTRGQQ